LLYNIYDNSFHLQVLINELYDLRQEVSQVLFSQMEQKFNELKSVKNDLMTAVIVACLLGWAVSYAIVQRMKQLYLREVYMLTMLNKPMLLHNKQIESYMNYLSTEIK
jgi:hypothetical protein